MADSHRLARARSESGRADVIRRKDAASVVARQTTDEDGVSWITFTPFDDTPVSSSEETRRLPAR